MRPVDVLSVEGKTLATKGAFYYSGGLLPGMSEGPYLNQVGKVVGIHRGARESKEDVDL